VHRQLAGKLSSGFDPPFIIIHTSNQPRGIKRLWPTLMITPAISQEETKVELARLISSHRQNQLRGIKVASARLKLRCWDLMQSATLCQHNHFLIYSPFAFLFSQSFAIEMQSYSSSKPPLVVDPDWI
jgi:hypothetical protein